MGPIGCPESLVTKYNSPFGKIPEERRYHFLVYFSGIGNWPGW